MSDCDEVLRELDPKHTLETLVGVGTRLSMVSDRRAMLEVILSEARRLAGAEAGSLFVIEGGQLRFVAAQNDRMPIDDIHRLLLGQVIPLSSDSLAGYVAASGSAMNIPDADHLPEGTPFRVHRGLDTDTGYRARSILALPLRCADGRTVGVLELLNRVNDHGRIGPFPDAESTGVASLAAMAGMSIENALLETRLRQAHLDTIFRLSVVVELRDNETSDHIQRIARTAGLLAQAIGLDEKLVALIEQTSPMHDIGKVVIPDAILHKPGPLTDEEREVVQQHPLMGAEILGEAENELVSVAHDIALSHHERWDGAGYPYGLAGDEIPLPGRVVGLADVLDALLSKRCYKAEFPIEKTLEIVRAERGRHFDPDVTDAFFRRLDAAIEPYVGTMAVH